MIPFTKAHACGNDFLIVTDDAVQGRDLAEVARHLCQRNTGVGADGVEFFSWTGTHAGRARLYNADGSIAEISGNGTRCVAAWMAQMAGVKPGTNLAIETDAGLRICQVNELSVEEPFTVQVTTGMGVPVLAQHRVTLADGRKIDGVRISTGNPHFVILVDNPEFTVQGSTWEEIGHEIREHADFPQQTNVEFVHVRHAGEVEIRIYERGVGPTTSSGTGSSASATAALQFGGCTSPLLVVAPGGPQTVAWEGIGTGLNLTGPASIVAYGKGWA